MILLRVIPFIIIIPAFYTIKGGRWADNFMCQSAGRIRRPVHDTLTGPNCSVVILSHIWVLTARHCFDSVFVVPGYEYERIFYMFFGYTVNGNPRYFTGEKYGVRQIVFHPGDEDAALVELLEPLRFSRIVNQATIGLGGIAGSGEACSVCGWGGIVNHERVRHPSYATAAVSNSERCFNHLVKVDHLRKGQLCLRFGRGKGACIGPDMGGPIICRKLVVGITTRWMFGKYIQQPNFRMCGHPYQVVVGVSMDSIYPWLKEHVGDMSIVHMRSVASRKPFTNIIIIILCVSCIQLTYFINI